jgi:hypothetical protein
MIYLKFIRRRQKTPSLISLGFSGAVNPTKPQGEDGLGYGGILRDTTALKPLCASFVTEF